ncbi:MAG TPA: YCF48-related protein [Chloroflexota bacterium]|nr:YCF48-related protein [Chloroflexota bacterium]
MRRTVSLMLIAALALGASTVAPARSGHAASSSAPTPNLTAVDFVDAQHGWVGGNGIFATTDGGRHWTRQYAGSTAVAGIAFGDRTHGWAWSDTYAKPSLLLHTTDGGAHWAPQRSSQPVSSLQAVGAQGGYAVLGVGPGGVLVRTVDGGSHWHAVGTPRPVTSACFTDPAHGWAVEVQGDTVLSTSNGGRTWSQRLSAGSDFQYGGQIACTGSQNAWALLYGGVGMNQMSYSLFHTADGGAHWRAVVALTSAGGGPAPGNPTGVPRGADGEGARLDAVSANTAFLVSGCPPCGDAGQTYLGSTHDGGHTWHTSPAIPHLNFSLTGISFTSAQQGWLAGTVFLSLSAGARAGMLLTTSDGGGAWTPRNL